MESSQWASGSLVLLLLLCTNTEYVLCTRRTMDGVLVRESWTVVGTLVGYVRCQPDVM